MRVVAISCVKNEEDIVEAFVRHSLAFVDQLVILDNGSTDRTQEILRSLQAEGIPIEIVDDSSVGYWQWKRMNFLLREHALKKYGADWIIPIDADEFIVVDDPLLFRNSISSSQLPVKTRWRTYVPHPDDDMGEGNPATRIRYRLLEEARQYCKIIIPSRIMIAHPDVVLSQGNHNLVRNGKNVKSRDLDSAYLAHIPIRDPGQYGAKVALGYLQYLAMSEKESNWGWQYEVAYALLKSDPREFLDTYREAALRFSVKPGDDFEPETILDPIPYRGGGLRYTHVSPGEWRTFRSIVAYAESLARAYSDLLVKYDEALAKPNRLGRIMKLLRSMWGSRR